MPHARNEHSVPSRLTAAWQARLYGTAIMEHASSLRHKVFGLLLLLRGGSSADLRRCPPLSRATLYFIGAVYVTRWSWCGSRRRLTAGRRCSATAWRHASVSPWRHWPLPSQTICSCHTPRWVHFSSDLCIPPHLPPAGAPQPCSHDIGCCQWPSSTAAPDLGGRCNLTRLQLPKGPDVVCLLHTCCHRELAAAASDSGKSANSWPPDGSGPGGCARPLPRVVAIRSLAWHDGLHAHITYYRYPRPPPAERCGALWWPALPLV